MFTGPFNRAGALVIVQFLSVSLCVTVSWAISWWVADLWFNLIVDEVKMSEDESLQPKNTQPERTRNNNSNNNTTIKCSIQLLRGTAVQQQTKEN